MKVFNDIVILAQSWEALQLLLNICELIATKELDIMFNVTKYVCLVFSSIYKKQLG